MISVASWFVECRSQKQSETRPTRVSGSRKHGELVEPVEVRRGPVAQER